MREDWAAEGSETDLSHTQRVFALFAGIAFGARPAILVRCWTVTVEDISTERKEKHLS